MLALMRFEDCAIFYYSDKDQPNKRILTHPTIVDDLRVQVGENFVKAKNSYKDAHLWFKGELLDITGMIDSLGGHDIISIALANTEKKKRDEAIELEKIS